MIKTKKYRPALLPLCIALLAAPLMSSSALAYTPSLDAKKIERQDQLAKENWAYSVGVQAFVFGLPLTIFDRERRLRLNEKKLERVKHLCPCAATNQVGHMSKLATAADQLPYTPNNDTVYSGILFDLVDEPVVLSLPDIHSRYWSVQLANNYLENIGYMGSRATQGKGGHHVFVGPNWQGDLPDDLIVHRMAHNTFLAAVRIGVEQEKKGDLEQVAALQQQIHTTSLSNWGDTNTFGQVKPLRNPPPLKRYQGELAFFEQFADRMAEIPPGPEHKAALAPFKSIGLQVGQPFDAASLDAPTRKGLVRALKDGRDIMRWKVKYRGTAYDSRWNNLHEGTYGFNYINRAEGALEGLIVHDREEAVYFSTYEDGGGKLLDATKEYRMHFAKHELPPVIDNGFWSLTMYGTDFQLVPNAIDRFAIGDRTDTLKYNKDGSLDIYIQHKAPEGHEGNWLPTAPSGLFRINYRIYRPAPEASNPETLRQFIPGIEKQGG